MAKFISDADMEAMESSQQKVGGVKKFISDDEMMTMEPAAQPKERKRGEAALESFGREATFGYLPELQAAAEPYITKGLNYLTGKNVETEPDFEKRKSTFVKRGKELEESEPVASTVGMLGGALATPIPGLGVGGGLLKTAAKGAASGAITGALYNPYAQSQETGLGLGERGKQALKGGLLGGAASAVAPAISKVGKGVEKASDYLAVKSLGPFKKEMEKLVNKNKYEDVAKFVKDKYSKVGSTPETIFEESSVNLDKIGKEIGNTYKKAQAKISDPKFIESLTPAQKTKLAEIDEEGVNVAFNILDQIGKDAASTPGGAQAVSFIEKTIAEPLTNVGNNLEDLMKFRRKVDGLVNWQKRTGEMPVNQEALVKARNMIQDSIDKRIQYMDEVVGGNELKKLKELNKQFGLTSTVNEISENRANAMKANMTLGLPELLVGAGYGGMSGGFTPEGIAKGLLGAAAMKGARTLGPSAGAKLLEPVGRGLLKTGKAAEKLKPGMLGRLAGGNNE